jgi:4-aminobutyrate--pyruvate transaminase
MDALRRQGILLRALGDSLVCAPPLIINAEEIELMMTALSVALDEVYDWSRRQI